MNILCTSILFNLKIRLRIKNTSLHILSVFHMMIVQFPINAMHQSFLNGSKEFSENKRKGSI